MIKISLIGIFRLWGSLWFGFLVSLIPIYIIRGIKAGNTVENGVAAIVGILATCFMLVFIFYKDGKKLKHNCTKEIIVLSAIPTSIHLLLSLISCNWFVITVVGNYLIRFLNNDYETWSSKFQIVECVPGVIICASLYAAAIVAGLLLGKYKHEKEFSLL